MIEPTLFDFFEEPEKHQEKKTEKKFFYSCGLLNEKIFYAENKPPLCNEINYSDLNSFLKKYNISDSESFIEDVKKTGMKTYFLDDSIF